MTLPWRIEEWPPDARLAYEERVAIVNLDGRIPLARAEAIAEECTRREWRARPAAIVPSSDRGEGEGVRTL